MGELICCTPKSLPRRQWEIAARKALEINPANHPHSTLMARALAGGPPELARIALVIGSRWPAAGVRLTVGFLDNPPLDLRAKILSHMNARGRSANGQFTETATDPQVRIARGNGGYWSYLGTDILLDRKSVV